MRFKSIFALALLAGGVLTLHAQQGYKLIELPIPSYAITGEGYGISNGNAVGRFGINPSQNEYHAALWQDGQPIDLNPSSYYMSWALGIGGNQQVGYGIEPPGGNFTRALLWTGEASSVVELNPSGYYDSRAYATDGQQQAGAAFRGQEQHAIVWEGTAASAKDLNPSGFTSSGALGVDNKQQVGYGLKPGNSNHALLWNDSANDYIDLHPKQGYFSSNALAIKGSYQVGTAGPMGSSFPHAILWSETADSAIDLHPQGWFDSSAEAVGAGHQVGEGRLIIAGQLMIHALIWSGSAASALDINPPGYIQTYALGIDDNTGIIIGIGTQGFGYRPVEWVPVPEPSSIIALSIGILALIRKRL